MNIKKLTPRLYASEQLMPNEISVAAAAGIKTIINNRPDNESPEQPDTAAIVEAADAEGIRIVHIPIVAGEISDANIEDFNSVYASADGPILAYCRSGMRSTVMWALAEAKSGDIDEIVQTAQGVGYDIRGLRPKLQAQAGT